MSHIKAILSGKEHRKMYRKPKSIDYSCTNHGSCAYCRDGRLHTFEKWKQIAEDTREEYYNDMQD